MDEEVEKIYCRKCNSDIVKFVRFKRDNSHFVVYCANKNCRNPLWEHDHNADTLTTDPEIVVIPRPKVKERIKN